MNSFSARGIILHKRDYGDHDQIVSILSEKYGRLTAIAKNAKKSVKRFGGVLELYTIIEAELKSSKSKGLFILSEVSLESAFEGIRTDYLKTAHAGYWAEIINGWTEEEHPQEDVYTLFRSMLEKLENGLFSAEAMGIFFQVTLLKLSGLSPDFSSCLYCNNKIDEISDLRINFDVRDGRIICHSCSSIASDQKRPTRLKISRGTINELIWIQKNSGSMAMRVKLSKGSINESRFLLEKFLQFHMGKDMNSLKLLNSLRKELSSRS